jgi:methylated-DNA-[protein]-cysteine S-methyltransferase
MNFRYIESPLGKLLLAGDSDGLRFIGFPSGKGQVNPAGNWTLSEDCCAEVARQLDEYFAGRRRGFDLKLAPNGTTFQLDVLSALQEIPHGETRSYLQIAERIGKPKAVRAVGAANGRNPLPIVIPCHRVIGSNGNLTGFGGGLDAKTYLLELEGGLVKTDKRENRGSLL